MKKIFLLSILAACWNAPAQVAGISGERMRAHVKYLASDLLEGRGVGSRGGDLATEYIASQFAVAGAKPAGDNGTYFQRVPLIGAETAPGAILMASGAGKQISFRWLDDFVGVSQLQQPDDDFDAEAIFVGHGITAPEFQWDDYKGADVKDKVVVLFTNEPPSDDPKFFGGKALTYYGRWTFKFEEAARRGAKACFIIHTSETAGYPYSVVKPLEGAQLRKEPGEPALAFAGWMSQAAGEKLLALAGTSVEAALKESNTRGFKAYSLGAYIRAH